MTADRRSARSPRSSSSTPATPLDVLVVSDDDPTLQALRAELRPDQPEVDGILGTERAHRARARYRLPARPRARALHRIVTACAARPELSSEDRRATVASCLQALPGPIGRSGFTRPSES